MYYYRCHSVLFALNVLAYNISHPGNAFVLIADSIDLFYGSQWPISFSHNSERQVGLQMRKPMHWTFTICTIPQPYDVNLDNNKFVFSFLRTPIRWHCPHSPAACRAAVRRAATDRYLLPAGPTAANLQQRVCYREPIVRQTDGRPTRRPCSAVG